jgi:ketosteroid isomerase-like protein
MARREVESAQQYLEAVARLDVPAVMALWSETPVIHTPLIPDGDHQHIVGRESLERAYLGILGSFERYEWLKVLYHTTDDPTLVIVQSSSRGDLRNGREYRNDYVFFLRILNDKIVEATEYFSPISAALIFAPA